LASPPRRREATAKMVETPPKRAAAPSPKGKKCPICGKPEVTRHRPFCSRRCAHLDLGRWLREDYRIATEEEADIEEESFDDG